MRGKLTHNWDLIESLPQTRIFKTQFPYIFQTMNSGESNNVSLKYERFTSSGY